MKTQNFTAFNAKFVGEKLSDDLYFEKDLKFKPIWEVVGEDQVSTNFTVEENGTSKIGNLRNPFPLALNPGGRYLIILAFGECFILNEEKNEDPRWWEEVEVFKKLLSAACVNFYEAGRDYEARYGEGLVPLEVD